VFLCDTVLYFASRELHIAATFCRNFHWTELNLWPQDVPSGSVIILSGNDDLCHAEDTRKMLGLNPHIKVGTQEGGGRVLLCDARKGRLGG
jgi:hypothetical protein